ncbi:NAD(P)/FAD-dependent oxidoreductase [Roseovarius atlanticus]|uniref:NAD(P)/FAD-dependent oxidoreductase n=1 Tax=Roseovarius atlanticus TaxID=1641875 RepID=UPI001C977CFB|nr:FAD-binding oxidoreductase [Roseovarius atlanticus]MBY5989312.1 FAD-binding oxidoreductase [Roseovarius atlanticus]MBY6124704.1 FAD-binding oxidoreductase [Roseovarius atlanticus]MBY6149199.1 FAD-binding oxidoreductase [Roseovarius atlanticus]
MNLLYSNDTPGTYPDSWYAATTEPLAPFAPLRGETRADVCVVGAGFTGLSAALHLAEAGLDVVLLEAHRVGFGASGRNGGQLGSGQRQDQQTLERLVGREDAARLWELAEGAKDLVKSLVARHAIDCHLKPGVAHMCFSRAEVREEHDYADFLFRRYGYDQLETLDRDAAQALCPSPKYLGGSLDMSAAHLHPLAFALGLARAARDAGVRVYERAEVHRIDEGAPAVVATDAGRVTADHVILGCNGYLGGLNRQVAAKVMPINNFVVATEPLGDDADKVLTRDVAVADSKFVVNYFRLSHDRRLLFGGGESYGYRFPDDIAGLVRKPMTQIFPHLRDVKIDHAWGGTLAITMKRMPYLARVASNVLSASGYSGHGVGMATFSGKLMADAVRGEAEGFDTLARVPAPAFPGGAAFRSPLLVLAMTWYATRDRLGI